MKHAGVYIDQVILYVNGYKGTEDPQIIILAETNLKL